jgi:RNA polymerase sigma-70 factor (ECF subfamily)
MTPYAWLYRIVMDCLIEAWRRETRARRDPDREMPWPERSSVQLALSLMSPGTTPSAAAARQEVQQRVRQTLQMLGPRDQEILWMRHYDDLTFKEAAAVLGIKESAANLRYVRALRRLKDLWQKLHESSGAASE